MEEIWDLTHCSIGFVYKVNVSHSQLPGFRTCKESFHWLCWTPLHPHRWGCFISECTSRLLLEANPSLYLDELQQKLKDIQDVHASLNLFQWFHGPCITKSISCTNLSQRQRLKGMRKWGLSGKGWWLSIQILICLLPWMRAQLTIKLDNGHLVGQKSVLSVSAEWASFEEYAILFFQPSPHRVSIIALAIVKWSITKEKFLKFLHEQVVCDLLFVCLLEIFIIWHPGSPIKSVSWKTMYCASG